MSITLSQNLRWKYGWIASLSLAARSGENLDFRFADFEIDVARHELRRRGELVLIEPQVFDLLVHLIRNRNRIVSKNELIDTIWMGRVVSEETLSSRVSAARRAIDDNGVDQALIRTHYKRGFRFVGAVHHNAVLPAPLAATSGETATAPAILIFDRPSIAVLPFENMSGDPEQDFLAGGLSEDIITGLSRQRWFSVIARNSSFAFKAEAADPRKVASELGVRYVLEGSVRKAADRVRVTAQLIDADKRVHLWAHRYDSALANIFEQQDEITNRVIDSVRSQIIMAEAARLRRKPLQNIDASDLVMQALPHMWRMSADEQRQAQELLEQAVTLDAEYAHAHALLGWTYVCLFNLDSHMPIGELTDRALDTAARALALDDQDHWGHLAFGLGQARRRRSEAAVRHLSRSVDLNPNFALGHAGLGYALACGGQPERGLEFLEQALLLNPLDPFLAAYAPVVRYMAHFALEQYDETITVCRSMAARHPNHAGARRLMTVSLGMLGRTHEARDSLAHTLTLQPDLSSDHVANNTVYTNESDRSRFLLGLQKAGLRQ
jgi:TolB-like protein/Flp pilus assembly protein TadD